MSSELSEQILTDPPREQHSPKATTFEVAIPEKPARDKDRQRTLKMEAVPVLAAGTAPGSLSQIVDPAVSQRILTVFPTDPRSQADVAWLPHAQIAWPRSPSDAAWCLLLDQARLRMLCAISLQKRSNLALETESKEEASRRKGPLQARSIQPWPGSEGHHLRQHVPSFDQDQLRILCACSPRRRSL